MAQNDIITGLCPQCGETLEIPGHLSAFSCVYCGIRLSLADLTAGSSCEITEKDAQTGAAYYKAHILSAVTEHRGIERSLTKNAYAPAVDDYEAACRETFVQLDAACTGGALTVQEAAQWFLTELETDWAKKKAGLSRTNLRDSDKFMIAVFLVPMIRRLNLPSIDDFCTAFHALWMEKYPNAPWQIGDYDVISSSFRKKYLGLCFITTAVCLETGKRDDCAELTAFRCFRDEYLQACPDGPALIEEYYRIAPSIVLEIEKTSNPKQRYRSIWNNCLKTCYEDLLADRPDLCKTHYIQMVRTLEKEYLN